MNARGGAARGGAGFALLAVLAAAHTASNANPAPPWHDSRQLVLVTTADWNSSHGILRTFSTGPDGWQARSAPVPVTIGRAGAAWGVGLHPAQPGPQKKEGDGRSPAGVFRVGEAFGYAPSARTPLPYRALQESDYCIDVSGSPLYNRIVDARQVGAEAVAGSTEPMRRDLHAAGDPRYRLGFVVEHNAAGTPDAGSCIFVHLWRSAGEATSGCTAMNESAMLALLDWLQPDQHPIFVLLPAAEHARVKEMWRLPEARTGTAAAAAQDSVRSSLSTTQ